MGVPVPFTVKAMNWDNQSPAAGVSVSYSVTLGSAALGCGAECVQCDDCRRRHGYRNGECDLDRSGADHSLTHQWRKNSRGVYWPVIAFDQRDYT